MKKNQNIRLMIVDDEPVVASVMGEVLSKKGFNVNVFTKSSFALERLQRDRNFDVVLTDIKMPEPSGLQLLHHARQLHDGPGVVLMTGYGSLENVLEAMHQGASDYLLKPISDFDHLTEVLHQANPHRGATPKQIPNTEETPNPWTPGIDKICDIVHELRNPCEGILGYAELAKMYLDQKQLDKVPEKLRKVIASVDLLEDVIDQIMDFSWAAAGQLVAATRSVNISGAIDELVCRYADRAGSRDIRLSLDLPRGLPPVAVDPVHLKRILNNLLSNAIKFSPKGSEVHISARVGPRADSIQIAIQDEGQGIPLWAHKKIFEPFRQLDENGSVPGAGLGLAIAGKMVTLNHGTISVQSLPGLGSTFKLSLPIAVSMKTAEGF